MRTFHLFSILLAAGALTASAEAKGKYLLDNEQIRLLPLSNSGITGNHVRRLANYKVQDPRPVPVADHLLKDVKKPGSLDYVSVPVELLEEFGVAREAAVRFGFPLPEGAVFDLNSLQVKDPAGKVRPAQFSVGEKWGDGSLKWVHISFFAPLSAREKALWRVEAGNKIKRTDRKGIRFTETEDAITVMAGRISAVVDKKKFNILKDIKLDGKFAGVFPLSGVEVQGRGGEKSSWYGGRRVPDSVKIIEQGPERLTIRVAGRYGTAKEAFMGYVARIGFRYDDTAFTLDYTHVNSEIEREFTDMTLLRILFFPSRQPTDIAVGKHRTNVLQKTERTYLADGKLHDGALPGTAEFRFGNEPGPSVAVADFARRYPKGFRVHKPGNNRWLEIGLLPEQPDKEFNSDLPGYLRFPFCEGKYRMKWGMSFTERMRFELAPGRAQINEAEMSNPVVAVLPASWYGKTGVYPGVRAASAAVDAGILESFKGRLFDRERNREFGFLNYGDSHGENVWNWTNNEYDMANGCFMTFIRTGDRELYRYALAAARHQADVDIVHAYADPYYVGGNVIHGPGHSGRMLGRVFSWSYPFNYYVSAANGHTWVKGMLDAWEMAGDPTVMDAAYLLGDHIALAMAPNFVWGPLGPMPRECGWALRAAVQLAAATQDPVYRKAADLLALKAQTTCNPPSGGIWPQIMSRLAETRGNYTLGNTVFIVSVALQAQCDYYRLNRDEKTLRCIRDIARWISCAFDPEDGCGFAYDLDRKGRKLNYSIVTLNNIIAPPLAQAAELLKDPKLAEIANRAMAAVLVRRPGIDGKFFSEYQTFLAEYLETTDPKVPLTKERLLDRIFAVPGYGWHVRTNFPCRFIFRLTSPEAKVVMQRWASGALVKKEIGVLPTDLVLKQGERTVEKKTFDPRVEAQRHSFTLKGKPGDEFVLEVRDIGCGDWSIGSLSGAVAGGEGDARGRVSLVRNGMRKFYVEVPAQGELKFRYYGTHIGPWAITVYDEEGKILFDRSGTTVRFSLKKEASSYADVTIKGNGKKRLCSMITWAESGAILIFFTPARFSTHPDFFKK
ncbi:MAG: hypothetical protein IJS01_06880 [Lentisphaeria bacterium]|nr:hypothetical protein [Lentisphaeria bacterium]